MILNASCDFECILVHDRHFPLSFRYLNNLASLLLKENFFHKNAHIPVHAVRATAMHMHLWGAYWFWCIVIFTCTYEVLVGFGALLTVHVHMRCLLVHGCLHNGQMQHTMFGRDATMCIKILSWREPCAWKIDEEGYHVNEKNERKTAIHMENWWGRQPRAWKSP